MSGIEDRTKDAAKDGPSPSPDALVVQSRLSGGLMSSLGLVLIGASIGVFWREVFQLTIRAIEAFR